MKKTQVLFPIGSFFPAQTGGPSSSIYWLSQALTKKGIDVYVVTTNIDIQKGGVEVNKTIDTENGKFFYASYSSIHLPLRMIYQSIKVGKTVDIIHLTSFFYLPSIILFFYFLIFSKKKIIWSPRGEFSEKALDVSISKLKYITLSLFRYLRPKRLFWHTTSTEETNNVCNIIGVNADEIVQLPNYMPIDRDIEILPKKDRKHILYLGRIHKIKGIEVLLKALNHTSNIENGVKDVVIAGSGQSDYVEDLKRKAKGLKFNVHFPGHVEGHDKKELYQNALVTVMPSKTENFGNVALESLACGTPVIASKGMPWEILELYSAGYWIDRDEKEFSARIQEILEMTEENYRDMSKNAYNLAVNEFDIHKNIGNWIESYNNVAD